MKTLIDFSQLYTHLLPGYYLNLGHHCFLPSHRLLTSAPLIQHYIVCITDNIIK